MSGPSRRRPLLTTIGLAALAALAVSLGVHPATVLEVAAVVAVLLSTAALVRLVPRSARRPARRPAPGGTDAWADARETVAGSLRSGWWVDTALRPAVREIVEARSAASGTELPDGDEGVRRLLPPEVADLVVPAGRGTDRDGLTPAQLSALLDQLEELAP